MAGIREPGTPPEASDDERDMDQLQESAAALLLRSPRLSVSLVMELLDISDSEFRALVRENEEISELLEKRRRGELVAEEPEVRTCPGCNDWYIPYGGARFCSDECAKIADIRIHGKASRIHRRLKDRQD